MKRWKELLGGLGLIVIAGTTYTMMTLKPDVSMADLIDAGFRVDCVKQRVDCSLLGADGIYRHKLIEIGFCGSDNIVVVPPRVGRYIANFEAQCNFVESCAGCDGGVFNTNVGLDEMANLPMPCRCAGIGSCTLVATGQPAPRDTTFEASAVTGAGCVPKPCIEVAGFESMPEECR
jgi:hypothetical protein